MPTSVDHIDAKVSRTRQNSHLVGYNFRSLSIFIYMARPNQSIAELSMKNVQKSTICCLWPWQSRTRSAKNGTKYRERRPANRLVDGNQRAIAAYGRSAMNREGGEWSRESCA